MDSEEESSFVCARTPSRTPASECRRLVCGGGGSKEEAAFSQQDGSRDILAGSKEVVEKLGWLLQRGSALESESRAGLGQDSARANTGTDEGPGLDAHGDVCHVGISLWEAFRSSAERVGGVVATVAGLIDDMPGQGIGKVLSDRDRLPVINLLPSCHLVTLLILRAVILTPRDFLNFRLETLFQRSEVKDQPATPHPS